MSGTTAQRTDDRRPTTHALSATALVLGLVAIVGLGLRYDHASAVPDAAFGETMAVRVDFAAEDCQPLPVQGTEIQFIAQDEPIAGVMTFSPLAVTVPAGDVTLRLLNRSSQNQELIVLPLERGQLQGTRRLNADGRVEELGVVAEATPACPADPTLGMAAPGEQSLAMINLPPGRYEIISNQPGQYAAGMRALVTAV